MKDLFKAFKKNRGAYISFWVLLVFIFIALFAPWIAPHSPTELFADLLRKSPVGGEDYVKGFFLGTDDVGRDSFSRVLFGARVSLGIGFLVVFINTLVGIFLGIIAGSLGGKVDALIMRFMDIILSLPSILLAIVIITILGESLFNTVLAVVIVSLPHMVRIVRAQVLVEKEKNYVTALKTFGASWWRIYFMNVLPNCTPALLVQASFGFSDGILNAAALGFLGLGVQAPTPEWGTMLSDARSYIESSPALVIVPGLCILVVVLACNLIGDGLREVLDPKSQRISS